MKLSGTLRVLGKQNSLFPVAQVLKCFVYLQKNNCIKNICLTPASKTNLPSFQGAQTDHMQDKTSSCCFPRELVSFGPWHMAYSLPIRECIWNKRYNKTHNLLLWTQNTLFCHDAWMWDVFTKPHLAVQVLLICMYHGLTVAFYTNKRNEKKNKRKEVTKETRGISWSSRFAHWPTPVEAFSSLLCKPLRKLNPRWCSLDQNALARQNTPALQATIG